MIRFRKLIFPFFSVSILLAVLFYALLPILVKKDLIQKILIQNVESLTGGSLTVQKIQVNYFPTLVAVAEDLTLSSQGKEFLKAKKAYFHLDAFRYLIGKMSITSLIVSDGSAQFHLPKRAPIESVIVSNLNFSLTPLKPKTPMRIDLSADLFGVAKVVKISGIVEAQQLDKWDWESLSFDSQLTLSQFPLGELSDDLRQGFAMTIQKGQMDGTLQVQKKPGDLKADARGKLTLMDWTYAMQVNGAPVSSKPVSGDLEVDFSWQPLNHEIVIRQTVLNSPIGKMGLNGDVFLESSEIKNLRLTVTDFALEDIPQYFVFLKDAIPFNFGFAGTSDLDISMEGMLDHLTLHANWNLKSTFLSYSQVFSKPKEVPMDIVFDFLLKDGALLSGDFSSRILDTSTFKGNLTNVDLKTGKGQLNLITNKFSLKGWNQIIPPLSDYDLGGEVKLLFNLTGNLLNPEQAERVVNLSIDDGDFVRKDGFGLKNVNLSLDYGPVALEIKKVQFDIHDSRLLGEMMIYNLQDQPTLKAIISSEHLEPILFLKAVEDVFISWVPEDIRNLIGSEIKGLKNIFLSDEKLYNFSVQIGYDESKILSLKDLQFEAYDGKAKIQMVADTVAKPLKYLIDMELDRISLAKYSPADGPYSGLKGNLFTTMHLEGATTSKLNVLEGWSGEGEIMITNGEFGNFDVLGPIAEISEFSSLQENTLGKTVFDDLRSHLSVKDGKLSASNLVAVSRDLNLEGAGDISGDGLLNFRLNVFLSDVITEKLLSLVYGNYKAQKGEMLGPIPVLLSGKYEDTSLKLDPSYLSELRDQILKRKPQLNFRNFLPEDSLFDKRTNF